MRCGLDSRKLKIARIIMTALSVAAIGFIFSNSMMNADNSAMESSTVMELINRVLRSINSDWSIDEFTVRKLAHFTEFAMLGALLTVTAYLYIGKRLKSFIIGVAAGTATAVVDELIQTLSEGRSCEIRDMLIDASGVVTAAVVTVLMITIIIKIKNKITEGVKIE